jgi:hypothetical protein
MAFGAYQYELSPALSAKFSGGLILGLAERTYHGSIPLYAIEDAVAMAIQAEVGARMRRVKRNDDSACYGWSLCFIIGSTGHCQERIRCGKKDDKNLGKN